MTTYTIPVFYEPLERQRKAARVLHLLAAFLMIANAWGDFNQPTPNYVFVLVQLSAAVLVLLFAFLGKKIFPNHGGTNSVFRLLEVVVLLQATWYFFTVMHLNFMATLQVIAAGGLLLLYFSERILFQDPVVRISDKGIDLPGGFRRKHLAWTDVENMRIRNDYISINTKQNRFIQLETGTTLGELQMDEMNAFCREQFAKQ
ncbi:MAG TPA: PH domain-containing protein [Lacibacter sp.]|nr:PH domain-containing protein [Lacibacter sp.]HMO89711.1 PH domain-containing protein [Lacibacter sp.]HMP86944.1 PH domain-containing protein [Lacibacter sp.]